MGLVTALGLKPTKAMLKTALAASPPGGGTGAAAPVTTPPSVAPVKPGAPLKPNGWAPKDDPSGKVADVPGAEADDPSRAAALALRPKLQIRERQAREVYKQLADGHAQLEAQLKAAPAQTKAPLEAKVKKVGEALAEATRRFDEARADLEALSDPTTKREDLVKLLARANSKAVVEAVAEVETAQGAKDQKFNERKQTTQEASYKDGVARIEKDQKSTTVNLEGVTQKTSKEVTQQWADGSVTSKAEKTVKFNPLTLDGAVERKESHEVELGGKKASVERAESLEFGKGGAKLSQSEKQTATDGSAREKAKDVALERGDGKLGVAANRKTTDTDAEGNASTKKLGAKGGLNAGEKGMGGYGSAEGGLSSTDKDGVTQGAVGGLHANAVCSIGKPKGNPPLYPLTIEVNLGAEIKVNAGKAKEGASSNRNAEITMGAEVVMRETRNLSAEQLHAYVAAAQAASKGGKIAATWKELTILQAGVTEGWAVANAMYKGGGKPLSKDMLERLKNVGDTTEMSTTKQVGGKVSGNVKALSVEVGASRKQEESVKATVNEGGALDVEATDTTEDKVSGKLGVSMGLVGGSFGAAHTHKTEYGIEITVKKGVATDDPLFAALVACQSEAEYAAFIERYKDKIEVKGKLSGSTVTDENSVGMSLAGAEASIGLGYSVSEKKKVDATGKVVSRKVVGSTTAGGGVKVGSVSLGDSGTDEAVSETDDQGNTSFELSHTTKETSFDKLKTKAKSLLPFGLGEDAPKDQKKGETTGLLSDLAGGGKDEDDGTESADKTGIKFSKADLVTIGKRANNESAWMHAVQRHQELDDWKDAARAIRASGGDPSVVGAELAKFVGGDIHRREMLENFVRGGGNVSIGSAFEFPESLKGQRKEYDDLIGKDCESSVREAAKAQGAAKAVELGHALEARVKKLLDAVNGCGEFRRKNAKAEMLSAITRRQTALATALREVEGKNSAADQKAAAEDEFKRLVESCERHDKLEEALFGQLEKLIDGRQFILMRLLSDAQPLVKQAKDLHAIWQRDLDAAIALAQKNGFGANRYAGCMPDKGRFAKIRRACYESG